MCFNKVDRRKLLSGEHVNKDGEKTGSHCMDHVKMVRDIIKKHGWQTFSFKHLKRACGLNCYELRDVLIVLKYKKEVRQHGKKSYKVVDNGGS